jgi:hypothetical protein
MAVGVASDGARRGVRPDRRDWIPRYFLYFEETDFCARAADAGFEAWHVPASRVVHIGGQATGLTDATAAGSGDRAIGSRHALAS